MTAASLIPRVKLVRAIIEAAQVEVQQLIVDARGMEQIARLGNQDGQATTLCITGTELADAAASIADTVGCLDDALTGLDTATIVETHPGVTEAEFEAIVHGRLA